MAAKRGGKQRGSRGATSRAGNAGLIASFVIALAGAALGAVAAYLGEFGAMASAARPVETAPERPAIAVVADVARRDQIVRRVIERFPLERFAAPEIVIPEPAARPKVVIIVDDIGLDAEAAKTAFSLPGPVTYSILPYAPDIDSLAAKAAARGGDVMLHLPMEPHGDDDPGPNALRGEMAGGIFLHALNWNLSRFDNYVGVNNHMGSKLTADSAAMKTVLGVLKNRDLYFIDSVTSGETVAYRIGAQLGVDVLPRDVFLDPVAGDGAVVERQLRLMEHIAVETGYVVAIAHPRPETFAVLGPWLATAKARGFDLTTPSALLGRETPPLMAAAPELRF